MRLSPRVIYHIEEPLLFHWPTNYLYLGAIMRVIGFAGPIIFLSAFLIETYAFSLVQVGLMLSITSIGVFLGNLFGGSAYLSRFDLRSLFAVITSLVGFGWLVVFLIQPPAGIAIGVLTLTYFLAGISLISYMSLLSDVTPSSPTTTMTLNASMLALGSALGTAISGLLLHLGGYPAIGIAMPFFTTISVLLIWQPRPVMRLLPGAH